MDYVCDSKTYKAIISSKWKETQNIIEQESFTYNQARKVEVCRKAMNVELEALNKNHTWKVVRILVGD